MPSTEVTENHHHHSSNQNQIRRNQKLNSPPAPNPPPEQEHLACPRCDSTNTKFCYYNNYNFSQPRHFCKSCRRYWTHGGTLRDIPVGGGTRKNAKRSRFLPSSTINNSPIVFPGESAKPPPTSFTSLLSSSGPGFLALNGFGLGLGIEDFAGFGLGGRGVWTAFNGVADPRLNGHGNATWQFDNGDPRFLVSSTAAANGVGIAGDFCSWNESVISSPANVAFK